MPGLIIRIDQGVGGIDLRALAAGPGDQYAGLASLIGGWQTSAPGAFGAAISGLAGTPAPDLVPPANLGGAFSGLLPALQGSLRDLVAGLEADVAALPARVRAELVAAIEPLLQRIASLRALLESDWTCGLLAAFSPPSPGSGANAEPGAAADDGSSADAARGAVGMDQIAAAKQRIDTLPSDRSVPSLLRWVHARIGTFQPGYFTLRSLPILDDLRDPLDTLIRWDDASATAVRGELQATIASLAALIRAETTAQLSTALPPATVAALPAAFAAAAESHVTAVEALATAVQGADTVNLPARLTAAQATQTALLTQNAAVTDAAGARIALLNGLATLPGAFDAGLCRILMLLQPRATFADLTEGGGPPRVPPLPADAFAVVTAQLDAVGEHLTALLDALDIAAVAAPVGEAISRANEAVAAIARGLAQLTTETRRVLDETQSVVSGLDLEAVRTEIEANLESVTTQLAASVSEALTTASSALGESLSAAGTAMDAIDPEALTAPIREVVDTLASLGDEGPVRQLRALAEQIEALAETIARLSFEPVADQVVSAIGELDTLIRSIDPASLPAPGPALLEGAMAVLPQSLTPLTDPLIVDLDVQIEASPIALLEQVKTLPAQVRERLLAFSPRAALEPLLVEPYRRAKDELRSFTPEQWLSGADSALGELRERLRRQIDIAALLADAAQAHATMLAELERVRPSTLVEPLSAAIQTALTALDDALPVDHVADGLAAVLARIRGFTRTLDAAMEVADHIVAKLEAIGDPPAEFDDWLTGILAKVPETATGALASALAELRAAARDVRPEALATAWTAAREPLAAALAGTGASAKLIRLELARSRIESSLGSLSAATERQAIATWLAEPDTIEGGDGLAAFAVLDRVLAETDAKLATHFARLGESFPDPDGPFAPLLPSDPAAPRAWVREALVRQLGLPVVTFLEGLTVLTRLAGTASAALRALTTAVDAKLDDLLEAPRAFADLLGTVAGVRERLIALDPGTYAREIDGPYIALLDQLRALDPNRLARPLETARDRLLAKLSLGAALPAELRDQLDGLHRDLTAKIGALDPDALLLAPLDETWRASIEPLVAALDIGAAVQIIIDWLRGLPPELRAQIDRVDAAYGRLLKAAPTGAAGAGASVGF